MHNAQTVAIPARNLHRGLTIIATTYGNVPMRVQRVTECNDGSMRVLTDLGEQRLTGSVLVRVLH